MRNNIASILLRWLANMESEVIYQLTTKDRSPGYFSWSTFSIMDRFQIMFNKISKMLLTHWGRVTLICIGNLTIIGSDNDLSPGRRQAIIWTNAGILLIGPLGINFLKFWLEL